MSNARAGFEDGGAAPLVETQATFLELHVEAFDWFVGVFEQIRFDNLISAVKRVLRGRRRVETDRFVALRSHYWFEAQFTTAWDQGCAREGRRRGRGRLESWRFRHGLERRTKTGA